MKKGDRLVCINNERQELRLTKNKTYIVTDIGSYDNGHGNIWLISDIRVEELFSIKRFKSLSEIRKDKLVKLKVK